MHDRDRALLAFLAANLATSILHYVDNVIDFEHYPEPTWLAPHLVDLAWFAMTPFGIAGYFLARQRRWAPAFACLYLYSAMNLLVLGHYLIAPPWEISFKINLFIIAEAATALVLGAFTAWLQFGGKANAPRIGAA